MKSIRLFLIVSILSVITLGNFLAALQGYRRSMREAERLFDAQLFNYAEILKAARTGRRDNTHAGSPDESVDDVLAQRSKVALLYQVWDRRNHLILRSRNAPDHEVAPPEPGFNEINHQGYRWRALVLADARDDQRIVVAQRLDVRFVLAEKVIIESVVPVLWVLPILAGLVWFIVGLGLKPIEALASQVKRKEMSDLSPIAMDTVPRELQVLVRSIDDLFARLEDSFGREKRFSSDAAHELRTPIASLKVHLANMLRESDIAHPDLQLLKQNTDRMGHVVEQILTLNRTTPDRYVAQWVPVDLAGLIEDVAAASAADARSKHQTLTLNLIPATIMGDVIALEIMLRNVISNALTYTPEFGHIRIDLNAHAGEVFLAVSDSGPGIPTEQHERVFERFYRLGGDRHASGVMGCGIGLSIVKQIVDLHAAEVSIGASRFATGLAVTFRFPELRQARVG